MRAIFIAFAIFLAVIGGGAWLAEYRADHQSVASSPSETVTAALPAEEKEEKEADISEQFPPSSATSVSRAVEEATPIAIEEGQGGSGASAAPPPAASPTPPPPPPVAVSGAESGPQTLGALNESDIILLSNNERVNAGLPALSWDPLLSKMAKTKAEDMLLRQYFAHDSPDGKNVAGLAEDAGYDYRLVGENLALGDFASSQEVVEGWMGSQGHRENILNPEYTEIGAAAVEGTYEGVRVYMAVQEFGRPMPDCAKPDAALKGLIGIYTGEVDKLQGTLDSTKAEIEAETDPARRNAMIHDYNVVVELYNKLLSDLRRFIRDYNAAVTAYNSCISA